MKFEELQEIKVTLARSLLDKLIRARGLLAKSEEMGAVGRKGLKDWFKIYGNTLEELSGIIKEQKTLCQAHTQCDAFLDQELVALKGIILHIRRVQERAVELDEALVRGGLMMVGTHSLKQLSEAA